MDAPNPMRWLAWELFKYVAIVAVAWLLVVALPGDQPRWLQFVVLGLVALVFTIVIYRIRVSRLRRGKQDS